MLNINLTSSKWKCSVFGPPVDAAECRRNTPLCVSKRSQWRKRYSDVVGQAIQPGRLFQHPPAAILNYHFAQTTLFFQISNTKKEELKL